MPTPDSSVGFSPFADNMPETKDTAAQITPAMLTISEVFLKMLMIISMRMGAIIKDTATIPAANEITEKIFSSFVNFTVKILLAYISRRTGLQGADRQKNGFHYSSTRYSRYLIICRAAKDFPPEIIKPRVNKTHTRRNSRL